MTTKQLAKQLGLIRRSSKLSLNCKNGSSPKSKQFFQYLIIIDFESTCWKDIKHYGQEIIEFPAVLLNTSSGEIESEFQTYVQPQEHPILSAFCTELTGIKQQQVDDGVPLKICLSQFSNWIQKLQNERGIIFPNVLPNQSSSEQKMCAFVTWSDWDLGVCLLYECKRKQLRKPEILNSWIDLRLTYKLFYNRKPKGLNGALQDVGIEFSGREHSGLDDSRNTARLAWRMICDGCVMKITKSLDKVRLSSEQTRMVLPGQTNGTRQGDGNQVSKMTVSKDDKQDLNRNPACTHSDATSEVKFTPNKITNKIGVQEQDGTLAITCVNVEPPKNLLNGLSTTILGYGNKYRYSNQNSLGSLQNRRQTGTLTSTPANHAPQFPSHVLFSTTIMSVNDVSGLEVDSSSDLSILADWEEAAVIADSQEEQSVSSAKDKESLLLPVDSLSAGVLRLQNYQEKPNIQPRTGIPCHPSTLDSKSVVYKSPDTTIYNVYMKKQVSNSSTFKLPTALSNKPGVTPQTAKQSSKTSSVLDYFPKRKLSSVSFSSPPKKLPFIIHEDQRNQMLPFSGPPRKVTRSILNSTVNLSSNNRPAKIARITAPMCNCGRRAKKLTVSNGGPNQGRVFYSCAIRKRDDHEKGCSYFKWEDTLLNEKSLNSPSILSTSGISFTSNTSLAPSACSEPPKTFKLRPSLRT
ncbi:PREDICTED: ERI1 exoribonuclease 2 [Nanorana parkeri]|uniref:ERI1 exoribonuclease 2 n=1 Tax=Nanorana parkeri TaxID=125878 RepID=UPI000854174B|nr:PREDICTED: ERI1 exoribonuclease 2 [Nanorana parkeri]